MIELKNCPFCGGKAKVVGGPEEWGPTYHDPDSGGDPYSIVCAECGVGFMYQSYEVGDVVTKWNKRVVKE